MTATPAQLAALQRLLEGSRWLGAEVDLTYRVLALTVELDQAHPRHALVGASADPRLQVLLSPSSSISACLRVDGDPPRIESFEVDQLTDVVAAMAAPELRGQMVGQAVPGPPLWPVASMAGKSTAPDGRARQLLLEAHTGERRLGLHATFDDVEVLRADRTSVDLT